MTYTQMTERRSLRRRLSYAEVATPATCFLCKGHHPNMSSPSQWKNDDAQQYILAQDMAEGGLVCPACRKDITRVISNSSYVPRWTKMCSKGECSMKECKGIMFTLLHKATSEEIAKAFISLGLQCSHTTIPVPLPLCKQHYHAMYNALEPQQSHCATCGTSLRHSNPKPCPQPATIEHYLREKTSFEGCIKETDKVCYACYRSHLFIIQQSRNISRDTDLKQLISTIAQHTTCIESINQLIESTMNRVAVTVGRELLDGNVLLLSNVHDLFCSFATELSHHLQEEVEVSRLVTSAYILSSLTATLQHHITSCCKTKKYGTLLYRPNTDFKQALAQALWQLRRKNDQYSSATINSTTENAEDHLDHIKVLNDLNSRACLHIKSYLSKHSKEDFEFADLNIQQEIAEIDPTLWEAVCLLTRSASERNRASKVSDTSSPLFHTKQVRRFAIFCIMMFCINEKYTIPLHTLITDIIEGQGGSATLVKIVNWLGLCTSSDTLDRYIQHKSSDRENTMNHCLNSDSFTVVSADNIDFLHSYARVYKGSNSSSWHGTSIQVVQPLPSLSIESGYNSESMAPLSSTENADPNCEQINMDTDTITLKRKRAESSSCLSPHKLTRSPVTKKPRQPRTGTEQCSKPTKSIPQLLNTARTYAHVGGNKMISDFLPNEQEALSIAELKDELNVYMLQKVAIATKLPNMTLIGMQDYFSCTRACHTEKSNVFYHSVMDAKADSKNTLVSMLHDLHHEFIQKQGREFLVLEGDAKLYELLQSLKFEYTNELQWLIPYPGDWHMLMNFQSALMKPYFDAGLKSMAEACGYPVAAIRYCSKFKKTHYFILEAWEALYRTMLVTFIKVSSSNELSVDTSHSNILDEVLESLTSADAQKEGHFRDNFNSAIGNIMKNASTFVEQFNKFIKKMAHDDDTWKFWIQFVFVDAMAYVGLYLAMRSGDWHLRMSSMKNMAPLFTAFDHPTYQKLISNHISDLLDIPNSILLMLSQGAFVVNISGREWHSVAIDEAHEMLINKQCKMSVVKPTEDYINRVATYLPYRTRAFHRLQEQIAPQSVKKSDAVSSVYSSRTLDKKFEMNVKAQVHAILNASLFEVNVPNRGLMNPFTNAVAVDQKHHDLLNFRSIGDDEYRLRISYFILKKPSVKAPNRRRSLQTFSIKQANKKRVSQLERDKKLVMTAIKKKIHFAQKIGQPIDKPDEQLLEYPLSLCDNEGNPLKGQKSYFTKALEARYKKSSPPIIAPFMPAGWIPQCSMLEGMFLINTSPLNHHKTLADYGTFLLKRFIISQFHKGSSEVHVIFDSPGRLKNTPKYFEQKRRDANATVQTDHKCSTLTSDTEIPAKKWRENFINCRCCKRSLVLFLGNFFLKNARIYLGMNQTLYVAGAFEGAISDTAWFVTRSHDPQPNPLFLCNAEETDTRLWLHVSKTEYTRILIMSPDTDVYMIGLPLISSRTKEIIVQISTYSARELRLLNISSLIKALQNDPDLGHLPASNLPQILQTIYVVTGCDYISFFSQIGKSTFLRYFFQYASFITAGVQVSAPGTLADTSIANDNYTLGQLAFLRLVGTVYFKKNLSGFDTPSPVTHFTNFSSNLQLMTKEWHCKWLEDIRQTIWYRTKFENEMMASNEALMLHWRRSCFILNMWSQADNNSMVLQPIVHYGWMIKDETLTIEWDTEDNIQSIRDRVFVLTKGCKCASGCATNRCGCKKKNFNCSAGCECTNCTNMAHTQTESVENDSDMRDLALQENDELSNEVDDIVDFVFGSEELDEELDEEEQSDYEDNNIC